MALQTVAKRIAEREFHSPEGSPGAAGSHQIQEKVDSYDYFGKTKGGKNP
jgi:hypothetical protein